MKTVDELLEEKFGYNTLDELYQEGISFKGKTIYINSGKGKVKVTAEDVIYYYAHDARNISSGCRSLGEIVGDWRPIDELAKTCLEIYKVLKRNELVRLAKRNGMQPKGW